MSIEPTPEASDRTEPGLKINASVRPDLGDLKDLSLMASFVPK
jgi:hypothetical protein